jgi:hypothetical protein
MMQQPPPSELFVDCADERAMTFEQIYTYGPIVLLVLASGLLAYKKWQHSQTHH